MPNIVSSIENVPTFKDVPFIENISDIIHGKALDIANRYRKTEAELIEILGQAESHKVYLRRGHSSLFHYVVKDLGLSESMAYNFIVVMRKAKVVPELKNKIENGSITLSNARRIAPVLTVVNQVEWLKKASELSQRQLEKEIVKIKPEAVTPERITYVTETRVKLELGLSEKMMSKLRRAQDLLSQSKSQAASLEDTLSELTDFYLQHKDPVEKAKRVYAKRGSARDALTQDRVLQDALVQDRLVQDGSAKDGLTQGRVSANHHATDKSPDSSQVKNTFHEKNSLRSEIRNSEWISKREPIPTQLLHQINLRDQRRCCFVNQKGERCEQSRGVEIHHKIPVSAGGKNSMDNLITLCSSHHGWMHSKAK